jgi:hypothetical protein
MLTIFWYRVASAWLMNSLARSLTMCFPRSRLAGARSLTMSRVASAWLMSSLARSRLATAALTMFRVAAASLVGSCSSDLALVLWFLALSSRISMTVLLLRVGTNVLPNANFLEPSSGSLVPTQRDDANKRWAVFWRFFGRLLPIAFGTCFLLVS